MFNLALAFTCSWKPFNFSPFSCLWQVLVFFSLVTVLTLCQSSKLLRTLWTCSRGLQQDICKGTSLIHIVQWLEFCNDHHLCDLDGFSKKTICTSELRIFIYPVFNIRSQLLFYKLNNFETSVKNNLPLPLVVLPPLQKGPDIADTDNYSSTYYRSCYYQYHHWINGRAINCLFSWAQGEGSRRRGDLGLDFRAQPLYMDMVYVLVCSSFRLESTLIKINALLCFCDIAGIEFWRKILMWRQTKEQKVSKHKTFYLIRTAATLMTATSLALLPASLWWLRRLFSALCWWPWPPFQWWDRPRPNIVLCSHHTLNSVIFTSLFLVCKDGKVKFDGHAVGGCDPFAKWAPDHCDHTWAWRGRVPLSPSWRVKSESPLLQDTLLIPLLAPGIFSRI